MYMGSWERSMKECAGRDSISGKRKLRTRRPGLKMAVGEARGRPREDGLCKWGEEPRRGRARLADP